MSASGDDSRNLTIPSHLAPPGDGEFLEQEIRRSPDPEALARYLIRYGERHRLPAERHPLLALTTVTGQSPFLGELLMVHPEYLAWAVGLLGQEEARSPEDLREDLARFRFTCSELPEAAVLRRFKHREYLRIALRDFFGKTDLAGTAGEISLLADTLLEAAAEAAWRAALQRHGPPQFFDEQGRLAEATFAVLSFGKLGGQELNYSSDIDLVYVYSREGQTAGVDDDPRTRVSNREFFGRVGEGITDRIAGFSPEGQAFRVDLNLRPGGKDGELVHSRRSVIAYYRTWARTWEKQAMIKARRSAGDRELGDDLVRDLQDSVYPPAFSPSAVLEIKEMKDRIDEELSRSGRNDLDIKLGRGGIRELEFGVQALQLVHGGREVWVREGNTLRALHRLADKNLISYREHFSLSRAYQFLRRLEHRLQLERNRQTDLLPSEPEAIRVLARRMGYAESPESPAFLGELDEHRAVVRGFYDRVFGSVSQTSLAGAESDLLLDPLPEAEIARRLDGIGVSGAAEVVRLLIRLKRLFTPERIRPDERREMRRFSARILREATTAPDPVRAFLNLERFFSSLMVEPGARARFFAEGEWIAPLLHLLGRSEALAQILTRRPRILEELETAPGSLKDRGVEDPHSALAKAVGSATGIREAAGALRRAAHRQIVFIGLRDLHRQDSLNRTLENLTALAEACLLAADSAAARFAGGEGEGFCVLGLGRLGYQELDYNSDLDLIFIADPGPEGGTGMDGFRRRAELLIRLLTSMTQEGSLYSVDLRLRPGGGEGELLQTPAGLLDYFRNHAQTWEKMAILKARPVAGDLELGRRLLEELQRRIFATANRKRLGPEVVEMKLRVERERGSSTEEGLPVKFGPGGLLEVHFLIEYLQIRHRVAGPADKDTLRMLTELHARGWIPDADYPRLYAGYLLLRSLDHSMRLLFDRRGDTLPPNPAVLARLAAEIDPSPAAAREDRGDHLLLRIRETFKEIRDSFSRLVI